MVPFPIVERVPDLRVPRQPIDRLTAYFERFFVLNSRGDK